MVAHLTEVEIAKALNYKTLIPAMEKALSSFSMGKVIQPVRTMLTIE